METYSLPTYYTPLLLYTLLLYTLLLTPTAYRAQLGDGDVAAVIRVKLLEHVTQPLQLAWLGVRG